MTARGAFVVVIAVGLLAVWTARAGGPVGSTGVTAKKLLVKNAVPDDESKNKVVVVSRDATIAIPVPGSLDDPRCGAAVTSVFVVGINVHQTPLPCENWKLLGTEAAPKGYRYDDRELDDGTARSVVWKPGRIKLVLKGKGPTVEDAELVAGTPVPSFEVTLLSLGSPSRGYCVRCTPVAGKDGSDGKTFFGKDCPAPPQCFASPSGAFLGD